MRTGVSFALPRCMVLLHFSGLPAWIRPAKFGYFQSERLYGRDWSGETAKITQSMDMLAVGWLKVMSLVWLAEYKWMVDHDPFSLGASNVDTYWNYCLRFVTGFPHQSGTGPEGTLSSFRQKGGFGEQRWLMRNPRSVLHIWFDSCFRLPDSD